MSFVDKQIQKIACDIGSVSSLCCGDCEKCHKDPTDDSCDFISYGRRLYEREYRIPCKDEVVISSSMYSQLMDKTKELAEIPYKVKNGELPEFPCKVGDTVYWWNGICFLERVVKAISYRGDGYGWRLDLGDIEPVITHDSLYFSKITRDAAEPRLRKIYKKTLGRGEIKE